MISGTSFLPRDVMEERAREQGRRGRERPEPFEPRTPYLVVQLYEGDKGDRPDRGTAELSIRISEPGKPGDADFQLIPGKDYQVTAVVWNLGAAPVLCGIAEYYALSHKQLTSSDVTGLPPTGMTSFRCEPGKSVTVCFPRLFRMPASSDYGRVTFVVQAYDMMQDRVEKPMRYFADRHVARVVRGQRPPN